MTSSIALTGNGSTIGTTGAANYSDGQVSVLYNAALGTQVAVPAGFTVPHGIRFTVPSGALQAPVTRFILTINSLYGEELNGRNPVIPGGTLPVHVTGDTQVVVTIVPDYTPLQAWRADYFGAPDGTGLRANNADYDTDGVPNLVEYITGTNPAAAEPGLNTANALTVLPFASSGSALRLRFLTGNEAMTDPKVRVSVQISSGLTGWTTPATRTGGGPWTGLMPQSPVTGNYTNHLFTTTYTPANTTQLYARLKVEELP